MADFILRLHGIVGNPVDSHDELGHGGDSFSGGDVIDYARNLRQKPYGTPLIG
jgi:hypothetical protein